MLRESLLNRRGFLMTTAKTIGGIEVGALTSRASQLRVEGDLPSLGGATAWLNSQPLTRPDLRGKVALIDFWTYTCINWRRTLPYVHTWSRKYRDHGLVVIGVHTPEFSFEYAVANVRQAVKAMGIDYPIAVDSSHAIWRAFDNEYWPALYFVDARGQVRARKFGEGDYEQSERLIQQLLAKAGATGFDNQSVFVDAVGAEAPADWAELKSQETYLSYERTQNFASPGGLIAKKCHVYVFPTALKLNHWSLAGAWTAEKQATVANQADGRLAYQFHARDLHLVMGPGSQGSPIRFQVLVDGQPPSAARGVDLDEDGYGVVSEPRMYQLVRQQSPIRDRRFEIHFLSPGIEVFCATFG